MTPACHVGSQRLGQQLEVLEHHGEKVQIVPVIILADIDAVQENFALLGIVESAEQLDERGLAAAVLPHHCHTLTDVKGKIHMPQGPGLRPGVLEGHIPEFHLIIPVRALLRGQAALVHGIGDVQKFISGPQELRILPQHFQSPQKLGKI